MNARDLLAAMLHGDECGCNECRAKAIAEHKAAGGEVAEKLVTCIPVGIGETVYDPATGRRGAQAKYEIAPSGVRALDFVHDLLEKRRPDILRMTYPRVYEHAERYHSPRDVGTMLGLAVFTPASIGIEYTPTTYRLMSPSMKPLIDRRMPLMFVSPALLEAVQRTDFKDPIDWMNMHLPYEEGIFVMPRGGPTHPKDGEIAFLYYGRQRKGPHQFPVNFPDEDPKEPRILYVNVNRFTFAAACPFNANLTWYDSNITEEGRPLLRYDQMFYDDEGRYIERGVENNWDQPLAAPDAPFLEMVGRLVFGLLLVLTARPELQGKEKHIRTIPARRDRPAKEYWQPNELGREYGAKRVKPVGVPSVGAFHASPREHWRRGHWRNQPYGPGLCEHKVIWIEPTAIGFVKEEKG